MSDIGFAMLPGTNFGIDDEKLITRMAYVDFDGEKALDFLKTENKIDSSNLEMLFPNIVNGVTKLKEWLKKQK